MKPQVKKTLTHIAAVLIMLATALIYFSPVLSDKVVYQGDTQSFEAMVKETKDFQQQTGKYVHWNSAMFSGMPAYQVGGNPPVKSIFTPIKNVLTLQFLGYDRSAGVLFFYLIGFYIAMLIFGISPWISLLGALAFGLGSYNIIIIAAGHITKAWCLALVAPILASMALVLRKPKETEDGKNTKLSDWVWGGILFTFVLGLQLLCNHIQITYYTIIGAVVLGVVYFIYSIKDKYLGKFMAGIGILLVGCVIAFACNARTLMVSMEYSKQTMRGGNAITVTPENLYHDQEPGSISGKNGGLDINYAFSWSYGIGETYTLLVPGAMGGGSQEIVSEDSEWYKLTHSTSAPLYWGDQPFTSGPVYFGAIVIFLFRLGCIIVKGAKRWWLLVATVISLILAWGYHCMPVNEFLFNHLPLYNKFRTPSMSLILANVTMIIMAMFALKVIFDTVKDNEETVKVTKKDSKNGATQRSKAVAEYDSRKRLNRALYWAGGIVIGILLVGMIVGNSLSFVGREDSGINPSDNMTTVEEQMYNVFVQQGALDPGNKDQMEQWNTQIWPSFHKAMVNDRHSLYNSSSLRSMIFVLLAFGLLWLYVNRKLKKPAFIIAPLIVLMVVDLWGVDRKYLNDDNYVDESGVFISPTPWDQPINEMAAQFGDQDYRVLNLATNTFNEARSAAYHHQIGGYSAVKMRRYQDLIDFYISNHINEKVLNMLNARYIIMGNGQLQRNPNALGNCWFVSDIKSVENSNDEILSLNDFNPATTAIVNTKEFPLPEKESAIDSSDRIEMVHEQLYNPDSLTYRSHTMDERLAVFSEIYYEPDWFAYIDGKPAKYIRVNYLLRGMYIPAGDHTIVFRNEAPTFHKMDNVTLISSIVFVLIAGASIFFYCRKRKKA